MRNQLPGPPHSSDAHPAPAAVHIPLKQPCSRPVHSGTALCCTQLAACSQLVSQQDDGSWPDKPPCLCPLCPPVRMLSCDCHACRSFAEVLQLSPLALLPSATKLASFVACMDTAQLTVNAHWYCAPANT